MHYTDTDPQNVINYGKLVKQNNNKCGFVVYFHAYYVKIYIIY